MLDNGGMTVTPAAAPLTVLSQNIRMDTGAPSGDPDSWQDRAPVLAAVLREAEADVIGTQEVLFHQIPVIEQAVGGTHRMIGVGREGGSRGEHNLLLLRRDRFEVLAWDQFWLAEEPERIGAQGWDGHCPRICVWARVRDAADGRELVLATTHLDHAGQQAQREGAALVRDRLERAADGAPIVLTGDFNLPAGQCGPWQDFVGAGWVDAHDAAAERVGEDLGTFPDYGEPVAGTERIDWILTRALTVEQYAVSARRIDGVFASDHSAVRAVLR